MLEKIYVMLDNKNRNEGLEGADLLLFNLVVALDEREIEWIPEAINAVMTTVQQKLDELED